MVIGVDFDNTIVCYDGIFHRVALERGWIPSDLPVDKSSVRNYLRQQGREADWTEMQGSVYGPRLTDAEPYPGVLDFFRAANTRDIKLRIISHKTRHPFLGEPHDLHAAAWSWLESRGFFDHHGIGMDRTCVFFELTKEDKHRRIAQAGCTHFIDDLPEFLMDPAFPSGIERFLFDPHGLHDSSPDCPTASSWADLTARCLSHISPEVLSFARRVLQDDDVTLDRVSGGGNNRIFRAISPQGRAIIKAYHHDPRDGRDRYAAEHAFYRLIGSAGVSATPVPLGWDPEHRLGAFTDIPGTKLAPGQVSESHVDKALQWLERLQQARTHPFAASIAPASDACFSLQAHLDLVQRRVRRLESAATHSSHPEFVEFVTRSLIPHAENLFGQISAAMTVAGSAKEELPPNCRCLSPSDFGFHNALMDGQGQLWFLDFEYAGWDDPAKLACDFFCQPQVPAPLTMAPAFVKRLGAMVGDHTLTRRFEILLPLHALKWCCILLNEFLDEGALRRHSAQPDIPVVSMRSQQLQKARQTLASLPRFSQL